MPLDYFLIHVVDDRTGRGVPMVELKTTSEVVYITDSNGIIAFHEPGLMNMDVYFHVSSHGYEMPPDAFRYRGVKLHTKPGDRATVKINRINLAERLYRVTGEGIYRDSILAGLPVPDPDPSPKGLVMGQDTVMYAEYKGKIYWIWGDTNKPSYPLGNFASAGATSPVSGFDPEHHIPLTYFTGEDGFCKKMAPIKPRGLLWLHGMYTLNGRLLCEYAHHRSLNEIEDVGLVVFNDQTQQFETLVSWGPNPVIRPRGRPFRVEEYLYFSWPYSRPQIRVKADWNAVQDPKQYETIHFEPAPVWIKGVPVRDLDYPVLDVDTGQPVRLRMTTCNWSPYRQRYIAILEHIPADIYYSESETPTGPWAWAKRIITHNNYTFYWSAHIPYLDKDNGRRIFIMGTYTDSFSGARVRTPRYNYNQILYGLTLDDPRLKLPESAPHLPIDLRSRITKPI